MYVGLPNPNAVGILKKMTIKNKDTNETITVLYNPQSYQHTREVDYDEESTLHSDMPMVQFTSGKCETLSFELFFDTMYAGSEVGGGVAESAKFAGNSVLPSAGKALDVRDYTKKIYFLARVNESKHRPPKVEVQWASLKFTGFLKSCTQNFIKFNELGKPVRATLACTFIKFTERDKLMAENPLQSPDTTKFHRVQAGDSLWALALAEYGDSGAWRLIADANGLANPRLLRPGDLLRIPAMTG